MIDTVISKGNYVVGRSCPLCDNGVIPIVGGEFICDRCRFILHSMMDSWVEDHKDAMTKWSKENADLWNSTNI